jgi:hypothetical protein
VHLHNKEPRPLAIADPARFFQIGKDMAVPDMAEEDTEAKSGAGGTVPPMRFHLGLGTKRRSAGRLMDYERQGRHRGRGPKGYTRSDDRIREEVCDRLTDDPVVRSRS